MREIHNLVEHGEIAKKKYIKYLYEIYKRCEIAKRKYMKYITYL